MRRSHSICLPVKFSGWDAEGGFFVELCVLDATELGLKTLLLRHLIQTRSLKFIRPLYDGFAKSHPEAQHVEGMQLSEGFGCLVHPERFPLRRNNNMSQRAPHRIL
jgi:hypothetical protein